MSLQVRLRAAPKREERYLVGKVSPKSPFTRSRPTNTIPSDFQAPPREKFLPSMRLLHRQHRLHQHTAGPRRRRLLLLDLHRLQDAVACPRLTRRRQAVQPGSHTARGNLRVPRAEVPSRQRLRLVRFASLFVAGGGSVPRRFPLADAFELVVAGGVVRVPGSGGFGHVFVERGEDGDAAADDAQIDFGQSVFGNGL